MYINMYIIAEDLHIADSFQYLKSERREAPLEYCGLWATGSRIVEEAVYIAHADELPEVPREGTHLSLVSIGDPPVAYRRGRWCDLVVFPDDRSVAEVFNLVQSVFVCYDRWERRLQEETMKGAQIGTLAELSLPLFNGNPILIHDSDFRIICFVAPPDTDFPDPLYKQLSSVKFFPREFAEAFTKQVGYPATFKGDEPGFWFDETYQSKSVFKNIHLGVDYMLRIDIDSVVSKVTEEDMVKVDVLARYIRRLFYQDGPESGVSEMRLETLLLDIIHGRTVDERVLTTALMHRAWQYGDEFICGKIAAGEDISRFALQSISERMRYVHSDSCVFVDESYIVFVQDLTSGNISYEDFIPLFEMGLAENISIAGMSRVFTDIFALDHIYEQASIALRYRVESNGRSGESLATRCLVFDDVVLRYILSCEAQVLPAEYICPKPLFVLMDYDKHHSSDLCKTLQVYLENNCSPSKCCAELFIHRSTFVYRLGKIEEIIACDLKDADMRLLYQISLRMINTKAGFLGAYVKGCRVYGIRRPEHEHERDAAEKDSLPDLVPSATMDDLRCCDAGLSNT